jgi:poly-beta-1,6-N-acetyl-D-glucosamine biosynthesis protein PgaD
MIGWLLLLLTWVPLLRNLLASAGYHVAVPVMRRGAILSAFPIASRAGLAMILISALIIIARQLWEMFGPTKKISEQRSKPLDMSQLATKASMTEDCLRNWQAEKVLYVAHDDHGEIVRILSAPPSDSESSSP